MSSYELIHQARSIAKADRGAFLEAIPETEMHGHLAALFSAMQPDYRVAITHGSDEYGKDLVLVRHDKVSADVIGVVVKRGDIKGKTLGSVDDIAEASEVILTKATEHRLDEISSQVKQALAHEADIPTALAQLPVTRVIVVLVGAASKQARARLRKERIALVEIRDLDWLIDSFTEHYPQVFFRGRTVDYLQQQLATHESSHFLAKAGKSLSDYYVEPLVTKRSLPLNVSEDELAVAVREKRIRVSSLRRVLESKKCVLLVGDPGSGKSTALAKLNIDLLSDQMKGLVASPSDAQLEVPMMVPAAQFLNAQSGADLLRSLVPPGVASQLAVSVLMVDGLDEIPADDSAIRVPDQEAFSSAAGISIVLQAQ